MHLLEMVAVLVENLLDLILLRRVELQRRREPVDEIRRERRRSAASSAGTFEAAEAAQISFDAGRSGTPEEPFARRRHVTAEDETAGASEAEHREHEQREPDS